MNQDSSKLIAEQQEWNRVSAELESENLKLMSYDNTLFSLFGEIKGKNILDYGAGPGVLALAVSKLGGNIKAYDINSEMREKSRLKIGKKNIYNSVEEIPKNYFDIVICNLVLCIVPEDEVKKIVTNIKSLLNDKGFALIGFCNPKIFNVKESNLDFRFPTGDNYESNHQYKKIKKEGGYEIIETHRPIEWYEKIYSAAGLKLSGEFFTPEYDLKNNRIQDFIIFKLIK